MGAYEAEQRYFLDLLAGRADTSILTARDARDSIALLEKAKRCVAKASVNQRDRMKGYSR